MRLLATLQRYEYRTDLQKNAQKTTKSNLKTEKRHKNHKKRKIKFAGFEKLRIFAVPFEKMVKFLFGSIAQLV